MTKVPKRPRDLNQWAKRMVDVAVICFDKKLSAKAGDNYAGLFAGRRRLGWRTYLTIIHDSVAV